MTIALGCDHAGFPLKSVIQSLLNERGLDILDFGTHSDSSVDYPDFVHPAAEAVENRVEQLENAVETPNGEPLQVYVAKNKILCDLCGKGYAKAGIAKHRKLCLAKHKIEVPESNTKMKLV